MEWLGTSNIENHVWEPWSVISGPIIISWYMHYVCVLPNGQWGTPITSNRPLRNRQLYAVIRRIKHWKQCLGAPMCYFGTNSPLLINALCVILPSGHWGTPHYSQPATEEWLHLTAIWGTWNTLNIENHLGGPWCAISGPIIVSWFIMCDTPNRPVRNAQLFLTGHWGMAVFDSNMRHVKHNKRWKPSRGA